MMSILGEYTWGDDEYTRGVYLVRYGELWHVACKARIEGSILRHAEETGTKTDHDI